MSKHRCALVMKSGEKQELSGNQDMGAQEFVQAFAEVNQTFVQELKACFESCQQQEKKPEPEAVVEEVKEDDKKKKAKKAKAPAGLQLGKGSR